MHSLIWLRLIQLSWPAFVAAIVINLIATPTLFFTWYTIGAGILLAISVMKYGQWKRKET